MDTLSRHRQHMAQQLAGVEKLPGTYPFTHERSLNSLRLNSFLHQLIQPAWRERFLKQPQALYAEAELSEEEQRLLDERDWRGLIQYGASFSCWRKWGGGGRIQPAYLRRHARTDAGRVPENAKSAGDLLGGRNPLTLRDLPLDKAEQCLGRRRRQTARAEG